MRFQRAKSRPERDARRQIAGESSESLGAGRRIRKTPGSGSSESCRVYRRSARRAADPEPGRPSQCVGDYNCMPSVIVEDPIKRGLRSRVNEGDEDPDKHCDAAQSRRRLLVHVALSHLGRELKAAAQAQHAGRAHRGHQCRYCGHQQKGKHVRPRLRHRLRSRLAAPRRALHGSLPHREAPAAYRRRS